MTDLAKTLSFIYSSPRSGSTWLTRCINRHPQLVGTEFRLFGEFCELWRDPSGAQLPRQTLDHFTRYFINHFATPIPDLDREPLRPELLRRLIETMLQFALDVSGKTYCVDKITPYLGTSQNVLQRIQQYCGRAKVIHLVRDGRDVLISGTFDTRTREGTLGETLLDSEMVDQWGRYWLEPQRAIHQFPPDQLQLETIRYEDLLSDTAGQLQRVFSFLEVDSQLDLCRQIADEESFRRVNQREAGNESPTAKARKGIAGDWQNYLDRKSALQFQKLCQHWLFTYGYVRDTAWVDQCGQSGG